MAFLQLIVVCLIIILCASIFAFRPMLANCSTHCVCSIGFVGRGGRFGLVSRVKDRMSGWFWRWVWGWWHVVRMALRIPWYVLRWCFHIFCCFLGKNPPWFLALVVRGGCGCCHACSFYALA
jgi:hypothetical protein